MNYYFADWYRITTSGTEEGVSADLLKLRWAGVEAVIEGLEQGDELSLVRLILGKSDKDDGYCGRFRKAIKSADEAFTMQGNDLEVSVLAAAALTHLLQESAGPAADGGALALICRARLYGATRPRGLRRSCRRLYATTSEGQARRQATAVAAPAFSGEELVSKISQMGAVQPNTLNVVPTWANQAADSVNQSLSSLVDAIKDFAEATQRAVISLAEQERLRLEESNVLWWMTAAHSRDLDKGFGDVKLPGAAIVAGKELADLVSAPGPLAAKSFLDRS